MGPSSSADVTAPVPGGGAVAPLGQAPAAAAGPGAAPSDGIVTTALRKVYPSGREAVVGLDLEVRGGEIFGLLGPNGAGKSTTVGMLTTRVRPTSGRAMVSGIDVVAEPARAKQVIGVVSQANTLDQGLNAWENLYFHGRYFGLGDKAARRAADGMLERFRLGDRRTSAVGALSGGMARRLMVARALLHKPAVVFLDEPTGGLDPQSRRALWEVLIELRGEGQTVLVTTHRMEEADDHCDRVAIMDHGRILAVDPPADLKAHCGAGASVAMRTEGDLEALADHVRARDGASRVRVVDGEVRLNLPGADGAMQWALGTAQAGGFVLTDLGVTADTLETVFVNLTGKDLRE